MKNNPQQNFGFEHAPSNEIEGILQAYLLTTRQALAGTARALWPLVEAENRRTAEAAAEARAKAAVETPVMTTPEVAEPPVSPTATEMLAQVAAAQPETLFTESTDPEALAEQQRRSIDAIHAEIEAERMNSGDFDRAA